MASKNDEDIIDGICEKGRLIKMAEKYIIHCLEPDRKRSRLPNICGFFRWLKLSAAALDRLKSFHKDKYRTLLMIFEDEALNSALPPAVLTAYLKRRLGYDREDDEQSSAEPLQICFEHDILGDGA